MLGEICVLGEMYMCLVKCVCLLGEMCILLKLMPCALFQTNLRLSSVENYCLEGKMCDVSD